MHDNTHASTHVVSHKHFENSRLVGNFCSGISFCGNDLVNFIGMPLAGYSTYHDYIANSNGVSPDQYLMTSLLDSASTPSIFLIGSGIIMVVALLTSKKHIT